MIIWIIHNNPIFIIMRCYIYAHKRLDNNEIFYIGRGTVSKKASGKCFRNTYYRAHINHKINKFWMRIIEKNSWEVIILEDNLSWDKSIELEKFYINKFGRRDLGLGSLVNFTDGGEGSIGFVPSEYAKEVQRKRMSSELNPNKLLHNRKKLSKKMKTDNPMKNPETAKKVSESLIKHWSSGVEHPRKGKPREDLRQRNLTNNPSKNPEVIEKIRKSALNRNNKGGNSPNAKSVINVSTGKIYTSIKECQIDLGISHTSIFRYLKKRLIIYV